MQTGKNKNLKENIMLLDKEKLLLDPGRVCYVFNNFFINVVDQQISHGDEDVPKSSNYCNRDWNPNLKVFRFSQVTQQQVKKLSVHLIINILLVLMKYQL
uniref:Uncharacterized protein n=1 Tax=Homalodisca liturata TaxID=320908 RepID=A0A1B6I1G4_9HEMI